MGLRIGLGLGLNKQGLARFVSVDEQIQLFKQRIQNDNGKFEAQQCLDDLINQGLFDNANFVLTPNGYKAGKLYALKPENGDLDVTWVRNGNATRVNQNGLIESVGNNVPRLDYLAGNCPSILVEEQRTNLFNFSDGTASNYGGFGYTSQLNDWGIGLNNKIIVPNSDSFRLDIDSGVSTGFHVFTFFVKKSNGTTPVLGDDFRVQIGGSTIVDGVNGTISVDLFKDDIYKIVASANINIGGSSNRVLSGTISKSLEISGFQIEQASIATSYIPTSGTPVTRPADAPPPITVPIGTTEIVEALEDGTFNTITTIPAEYTIPFGRFKYILFNGA